MKFIYALIVCFLYILSTSPALSEYYHYINKDGIKHYTDDITEIPEDQRPNLDIHKSIETSPEKKPSKKKDIKSEDLITLKSLEIKKQAIDTEYEVILNKRQALTEQKKTIGEKEYNKLARQLNIEIKQYQAKNEAYKKLVEQYNKQIISSEKN